MRTFDLAKNLLEQLVNSGIRLRVVGDELQVNGDLNDGLREQIRKYKTHLVELVQAGEHRWKRIAEWDFRREDNRMIGQRLDAPGEISWTIENDDPGAESEPLQTMIEDLTA